MSLLTTLLTFVGGALLGPKAGQLINLVASRLLEDPQTGGLGGLLKSFQDKGYGDQAASWVSTGQNQSISADQIQDVLGGLVQQVSQALGVSQQNASASLAELLPNLIDKLTPDGQVPDSTTLAQRLAELKTESQQEQVT